ncbi:MAG TPA: hypothetical protein VF587_00895 [Solirubrobacteraceae bacterium]
MAIVLLAAGCMDDDEPRFGGKELAPRPIEGPPGHFHPSAVRAYWFFNEAYGQRREVHFVATGPRSTHVRQARECVEHHLDEGIEAPFCLAYPTERAFRAAEFSAENGQTFKNCWSARAEKPADSGISQRDAGDPEDHVGEEGCPDLR